MVFKKGHTINKGREVSDESRIKMSEARKGIKFSDEHKRKLSEAKKGKCPKTCFKKGHKSSTETLEKIRKSRIGKKHSEETKNKISKANKGKNNGMWKGKIAKYFAIHMWVRKNFEKRSSCEICECKDKKLEWSNKDHKYKRNKKDWQNICRSCHYRYDRNKNMKRMK